MKVTLHQLRLRNFKGVHEFTLDAAWEDVSIHGDNATGKTSLADAFHWLLFGKDSSGRANFEIKTLGADGEPEHGLDHSVEAELSLAGKKITLKKVYKEVWKKTRGSAQKTFAGNTTEHYIDGVPVRQAEYQQAIAELCDESVFRLLTDPVQFAERLHWQERRKILLDVCGDVADEDVIASQKALADLPEILEGRTIDNHRKVIAGRRRDINRDLERLPVRIDEVTRSRPDVSAIDENPNTNAAAVLLAKRE
ncbi:MAG: AAA family ATPase, partial [Acidobacteriota bacterium]